MLKNLQMKKLKRLKNNNMLPKDAAIAASFYHA